MGQENKKQIDTQDAGITKLGSDLIDTLSDAPGQPDKQKVVQEKKKRESIKEAGGEEDKRLNFLAKLNAYFEKYQIVPLKERIFFAQNLAIMLKTGLSLANGLATIASQTNNKRFARVLINIQQEVEKGVAFSQGLKKYRKIFGDLFISMVESGEASGKLEEVLKQLHAQMKRDHDLISKVRGAMIYPCIVVVAMVGIGILMVVFVLPRLTAIFKEVNMELPLPTRILIGISDFVAANGLMTALIIIVVVAVLVKLFRTEKGRYYLHLAFIKLPVLTPIVRKINLARFSHTLSALLKTDIPIVDSFMITANTLGNIHYRQALGVIAEKIKKGQRVAEGLKSYKALFPPIITQMVVVGEESGSLDTVLEEIALFFEEDIDQTMKNLPSIIEPVLMLLLGAGVAGIAVSVLMPMYSMTQAF